MADNIIDNRKKIRQRFDHTALHITQPLDASTTIDKIKMDIVCQKVTIELGTLTASLEGSVDGINFFSISGATTGQVTYGDGAGEHLLKWIRVTRTAGEGRAIVVGV